MWAAYSSEFTMRDYRPSGWRLMRYTFRGGPASAGSAAPTRRRAGGVHVQRRTEQCRIDALDERECGLVGVHHSPPSVDGDGRIRMTGEDPVDGGTRRVHLGRGERCLAVQRREPGRREQIVAMTQ